jgi:hypothetical protein
MKRFGESKHIPLRLRRQGTKLFNDCLLQRHIHILSRTERALQQSRFID